ncbi:MAG: MFS transporter [Polyangiaceae bacterium]|nr:MFS transporter [Polyangiaceae bacterium]
MKDTFSRYQIFVVALLAFLQFTVVLDFMILSPLGVMLHGALHITPKQFGLVVSAYAFSAAASGFVAAGFADRFDRRKFLLFFYGGFVVGTLLCATADTYEALLGARIITGLFGGVIGSISLAIVADLFPMSMRGRVMGLVQTAFSASQVLGIPFGLVLATHFGWHTPFLMIAFAALLVGVTIFTRLRPIRSHLDGQRATSNVFEHLTKAFMHLAKTATYPRYIAGFAATMLLTTGGFMLAPFGSNYLVYNLHVPIEKVPIVFAASGAATMISGPLFGQFADAFGKYLTFAAGSVLTASVVLYYTSLTSAPFGFIVMLNIALFVGISARMGSSFAMISGLPNLRDRGAYMSISASIQQLSGGTAAACAGLIVHQKTPASALENYPRLGWVVATTVAITLVLMFNVHRLVTKQRAQAISPKV